MLDNLLTDALLGLHPLLHGGRVGELLLRPKLLRRLHQAALLLAVRHTVLERGRGMIISLEIIKVKLVPRLRESHPVGHSRRGRDFTQPRATELCEASRYTGLS